MIRNGQGVGFLKTERRNLFYRDFSGKCIEIKPICVLDFYVHESVQRGGVGKVIIYFFIN